MQSVGILVNALLEDTVGGVDGLKWISLKPTQLENAEPPILVTPLGIVIFVKE